MNSANKPTGMSRRQFLVKAGVATAAVATLPLQTHAALLPGNRLGGRIGVVLPQSTLQPLLGENYLAGMRLGFARAGFDKVDIVTAAGGDSLLQALDQAQQLLTSGSVDILTGFFNPLLLPRLQGVLEKSGALLINAEAGANLSTPGEAVPNILHNSLGYWQANRTLAGWASRAMGKRAATVSSFYESGYDAAYAFRHGYEQAGGTIVSSDVTHIPARENDFPRIFEAIAAAAPDFIHASYSGQAAIDFVTAYGTSPLAGRIPLTAAGFTVDERLLASMGRAALGIRSCFPWAASLPSAENMAFCAAFARKGAVEADPAALLGYDAAAMIATAAKIAGPPLRGNGAFVTAMQQATFTGPRGACAIDRATGNIDTPLYLREVRLVNGSCRNVAIAELPRIARSTAEAGRLAAEAHSAWLDSYLCV